VEVQWGFKRIRKEKIEATRLATITPPTSQPFFLSNESYVWISESERMESFVWVWGRRRGYRFPFQGSFIPLQDLIGIKPEKFRIGKNEPFDIGGGREKSY